MKYRADWSCWFERRVVVSELRARNGDHDPDRPDREQPADSRPERPDPVPEPEEPLPNWADRYSPEMRRKLAADDTIARLHYTSPRDPSDSREPTEQDTPQHDAVRPAREPSTDDLPHLPAKLREQMANDPVFTRAGWSRENHDPTDDDPPAAADGPNAAVQDHPAAGDHSGSHPPPEDPPTNEPPATASRPGPAVREHRAAADIDEPQRPPVDSAEVARTTPTEDGRRPVADPPSTEHPNAAEIQRDQPTEPQAEQALEHADQPAHEFVDTPDDPRDMDIYRRIREADDVDAVAINSGYPREVVEVAKENLFIRQHDVAVGPGETRHGYFTPLPMVGQLWEQVASGADLTDKQQARFWSLLAHEYVEARLMEAGVPYLLAATDAWDERGPKVGEEYPTAHTVAPRSLQAAMRDLLGHWEKLNLPQGDLRVAEDLSNLDEVVRVAKEGLGL
ncbi:hypothetical protein ACFV9C_06345 [Kribbella sp. NPDC059898]|uniref:hypothetical protein n=1 Tax=Kribbella sp. NPDC059898 TaxID=3346995 RepID=UPI0036566B31